MTIQKSIVTLLQSNFQVLFKGVKVDLALKQKEHKESDIQEAIETLNTEGDYTFIRKIGNENEMIL